MLTLFPLAEMLLWFKVLVPLAILMGVVAGFGFVAEKLFGFGRISGWTRKGKFGEAIVEARLQAGLPQEEYSILSDLYLPFRAGGTTQIDHVVVSRFGVFVVETKNYTGWIFGDAGAKTWTQTVYRKKSRFQNPLRQNYAHVCAIADNLGLPKKYIHGVVAFTGDCEFKTEMPEGVVYSRDLAAHIRGFWEPLFTEADKESIVSVLKEWDASVSEEQRNAHVENLRRRHAGKGAA